jgi:peptidyl-prolyl cis-trans isomerase B (cyclophilin B)
MSPQSSIATRKLTAFLVIFLLASVSCGRRKMSSEELIQNPVFAEIIKREAGRVLGEDGFFPKNLFANPYPEVRNRCAIALGRIGDRQALPWLYTALHKGDASVRAASAFAIGEIEDRKRFEEQALPIDPQTLPELSRLLDDPSLFVQMRAIEALGKTGSHTQAVQLIGRLERFPLYGTPGERARLEFSIAALARIGDAAAFPILEKLSSANDPGVRWRALNALSQLRDSSAQSWSMKSLSNPKPLVEAQTGTYLSDSVCIALAASRLNQTTAIIETNRGEIEIELFRDDAPVTTAKFIALANRGAFKKLRFSYVSPYSLIQIEEPRIQAPPGRNTGCEINMHPFGRGSVGMVLEAKDSQANSFFISLNPQPARDGLETCFGRVISGIQAADKIVPGDYIKTVHIKESISLLRSHRY